MAISREDVLHVATLARLDLADDAVDALVDDLEKIAQYVSKLTELDTEGVAPTTQVAEVAPLRPDEVRVSVPTETALREAPRSTAEGFRVPGFVDE